MTDERASERQALRDFFINAARRDPEGGLIKSPSKERLMLIGWLEENFRRYGAGHPISQAMKRHEDGTPIPPERPAVCVHDVRGPLRQACCCCGACDHLDFRVTDEAWAAVVPVEMDGAHICLRCFDALAAERGVDYADALSEMCFVGDAASFSFRPVSAVSVY